MNQETENNFKYYLESVPSELRDAIISSRWEEKLIAIGRRNGVHIDNLGNLQDELAFVMGGASSREEFRRNLVDHLNLREAEVDAIISDINKLIMSDIQARLKRNIEESERREHEEEMKAHLGEHGIQIGDDTTEEEQKVSIEKKVSPDIKKINDDAIKSFQAPFTLQSMVKKQVEESKAKSESRTPSYEHADPYRERV